jgi:NADH-quinone oxidoreductase subunit G
VFATALGGRFTAFVKRDHEPAPGERLEDDLLIRPDKNPNAAGARAICGEASMAEPTFPAGTDLVLVWGEGCNFARLPAGAKVVFLNSYLQPENGHADVFIPVSIQTERAGHYTNFAGVVSGFERCFEKKATVVDAQELFAALAVGATVTS